METTCGYDRGSLQDSWRGGIRVKNETISIIAEGTIKLFSQAGMLSFASVHCARQLSYLYEEKDPDVLLAIALAFESSLAGSTCLPISEAQERFMPDTDCEQSLIDQIVSAWPANDSWLERIASSPLVTTDEDAPPNCYPARLIDKVLYLERDWLTETRICKEILSHLSYPLDSDSHRLDQALDAVFSADERDSDQYHAVKNSLLSPIALITGGPGTGKTTTIAKLLAVYDRLVDEPVRVHLASFTGKAAARIQQSFDAQLLKNNIRFSHVDLAKATTVHSLLGAIPAQGFRYNSQHPIPSDCVIIDEVSMISLPLMDALLQALAAHSRLILVGDADQLVSVDAGNVLDDVAKADLSTVSDRPVSTVSTLRHTYRYSGDLAEAAHAIRQGDSTHFLDLVHNSEILEWVDIDPDPSQLHHLTSLWTDIEKQNRLLVEIACGQGDIDQRANEAVRILDSHRLLCAHREGRYGVNAWSRAISAQLRATFTDYERTLWYPGRPLLVTRNAHDVQIANGDTGVVIYDHDSARIALSAGGHARLVSPWILGEPITMHCLTVHKSQGSEYDRVSFILPDENSPLLNRQLLYTAITRARTQVRIIGSQASIETAIATPIRRATRLAARLSKAGLSQGE